MKERENIKQNTVKLPGAGIPLETYSPIQEAKVVERKKERIKKGIHQVRQQYGSSRQLELFTERLPEIHNRTIELSDKDKPTSYGINLTVAQNRVFEAILRAFSKSNYKGDKRIETKNYINTYTSQNKELSRALSTLGLEEIPILQLTQSELLELSGYGRGDKKEVVKALQFLAKNQYLFYYRRAVIGKDGNPTKDRKGNFRLEDVEELGTLLRVKRVLHPGTNKLHYYEIHPAPVLLDQIDSYFFLGLVDVEVRDKIRKLTGSTPSRYTTSFLQWLELQFELIRRYNNHKKRAPKPYQVRISWEELAITLKMPESVYKRNKRTAKKHIDTACSTALELGYLTKLETDGVVEIFHLNEEFYYKPGREE